MYKYTPFTQKVKDNNAENRELSKNGPLRRVNFVHIAEKRSGNSSDSEPALYGMTERLVGKRRAAGGNDGGAYAVGDGQ